MIESMDKRLQSVYKMDDFVINQEKPALWSYLDFLNRGYLQVPPLGSIKLRHGRITYPLPDWFKYPLLIKRRYELFDILENQQGWSRKKDTKGVLRDFMSLASGTTKNVLNFVERWGPMWVCDHSFSEGWYDPGPPPRLLDDLCLWGSKVMVPEEECSWRGHEPVWIFLEEAARVRALYDAALALKNDQPIPRDCLRPWRSLQNWATEGDPKDSIEKGRQWVINTLNYYLLLCQTGQLEGIWEGERPSVKIIHNAGFYPLIWSDLFRIVTGKSVPMQCPTCGDWFVITGRRRKHCSSQCRKSASARRKRHPKK